MPRTIDQQIAEAENRVQRLKTKKRTKDTRRKMGSAAGGGEILR
jgi:hypothetical protein